jgi:membrane protease YdiL (CAAX protease family)
MHTEATSRVPFARRLLLLLLIILVAASVVAPFVSWALAAVVGSGHRFSFPRVYDRVLQIITVCALIVSRRWLGLTSWAALGLGRSPLRRDLWVGLAIALGGMVIVIAIMWWGDALRFFWRYPLEKGMRKAVAGTIGAVLIGTGEELLFRGVLLGGLMRDMRRGFAIAWTTGVYAVVHFLRGGRQVGQVTLTSGFERLASAFAPLADPEILPALVGFVILGLLLAHARLRSGALYLPLGLHIGWVFTIRVGRIVMDFPREPGLLWGRARPPLVSGALGWCALVGSFLALHVALRSRPRPGRYSDRLLADAAVLSRSRSDRAHPEGLS